MAIKTKQILAVDFSKTDSILNANGKTALNFVGVEGYTGISGESDGKKILLKKDGVLIATISNITGLKYTEVNGDDILQPILLNQPYVTPEAIILKRVL